MGKLSKKLRGLLISSPEKLHKFFKISIVHLIMFSGLRESFINPLDRFIYNLSSLFLPRSVSITQYLFLYYQETVPKKINIIRHLLL
jgi:hypothetical protein